MASEYWDRTMKARTGRRWFLTSSAGMAGGLAALAAVGCGDDDSSKSSGGSSGGGSQPTKAAATAAGETPTKGGVLKQWGYSEIPNFDPHQTGTLMTQHVFSPVFNGLLR